MASKLKKDWKKVIEEDLIAKKSSLKTFADWENCRRARDNWKELLCINRPDLTKSISVDEQLYDTLLSLQVFNKRTLDTMQQKKGHCAKASAMLDYLSKRPFEGFLSFCQSLVDTGQKHIVLNYLTPEIPQITEPSSSEETDAVPAEVQELLPVIEVIDWRKRVRDNLVELTSAIDPDSGLLLQLNRLGVINDWTIDTFDTSEGPRGKSHRVARILDHILLKRPDEDFAKLCVALRQTSQGHVVDHLLTAGGVDRTDLAAFSRPMWEGNLQLDESKLQSLLVLKWKDLIISCRNDIVNDLNVSDDLLNELVKYEVMNIPVWEVIKEEGGSYRRAEMLLDHMQRRSARDFALFRLALELCCQAHVIQRHITSGGSESTPATNDTAVPAALSQPCKSSHSNDALLKRVSDINQSTLDRQTSQKEVVPVYVTSSVESGNENTMLVTSKQSHQRSEIVHDSRESNNYSMIMEQGDYKLSRSMIMEQGIGGGFRLDGYGCTAEPMETQPLEDQGPTRIDNITVQPCNPQFYKDHKSTAYEMSKRTRGKCYIFNIEHVRGMPSRKGTTVDGKNIKELFTKLHFYVDEFSNFDAEDIRQKILEISNDASLERDQCLAIFIMSHGTVKNVNGKMKDCIYGSDGNYLTPESILIPLTDRMCRHLRGKPRLVFFQACRGEHYDKTDCVAEEENEIEIERTETDFTPDEAPSYTDFLIGYPTQSSYRSFRNTEFGSWYINAFVKVFMRHVHNMGLCAMLNVLNGHVSQWASNTGKEESTNKTQIANYVSNLRKADLFFFPGIVDD